MLSEVHPAALARRYCWEPAQRCARGRKDPPLLPQLPTHIPTPVAPAHSRVSSRRCMKEQSGADSAGPTAIIKWDPQLMFPEELLPLR